MTELKHSTVKAVLDLIPVDHDGETVVSFGSMDSDVNESSRHYARPERLAVKYAVAVLREHAAWLRSEYGVTNRAASATNRRADEIEDDAAALADVGRPQTEGAANRG